METRTNIGDLDTLVTIQLREQTVGSQGQRSWTVTASHEVFASVSRNISESVGSDNLEQVNGVSLTVCNSERDGFEVCLIPYTHDNTNFHQITEGTVVNLEFDIIGKYLSRMMECAK